MDNDALLRRISSATLAKKMHRQHGDSEMSLQPVEPVLPTEAEPQLESLYSQPATRISVPGPQSAPGMVTPNHPMMQTDTVAYPLSANAQENLPSMMATAQPHAAQTVADQNWSEPTAVPAAPGAAHPAPLSDEQADSDPDTPMSFVLPENAQAPAPVERMPRDDKRGEGYVVSCDGTMAIVQGDSSCVDSITGLTWAVGRMLSIKVGSNRIVGMICEIEMPYGSFESNKVTPIRFHVELQGEVQDTPSGRKFTKGISSYPGVGSVVHQIRSQDLASIYAATGTINAFVGSLTQDSSIPALVDIPDMLAKHFAVLGSTGCGKSASVSLLLHASQELIPDLRTIILDPHNEYTRAFPHANTVSQNTMDIPFWMFQLEEYVEVLFRGKPIVHEEVDALREFIPEAKLKFRDGEDRVKLRSDSGSAVMTADTAAPYRMADLLAEIEEEMGLLESRYDRSVLKSLKARINAHCSDTRYAFMFRHRTIEDIADEVVGNFFSLPGDGSNTTIVQMAGMPAEVVNSVASVLCRLSFELAIAAKGNLKVLVVCEEAHRYVPADKDGFEPTRRAIARIAKEGRKYGAFMAIVSQRPSELDATILSQCSTVFSLRLTNDFDQDIIRRAISSSSASTVSFISSLSNRECIAFGEGMSTPMRLKFRDLPARWLPGAEADVFGNSTPVIDSQQSYEVFRQWRHGND